MIVEYLTQQDMTPFPAGTDERPAFSPDSTALEVTLNPAVSVPPSPSNFLRNGQGFRYFAPNDNMRVLSLGMVLPYAYSISTNFVTFVPGWIDDKVAPSSGYVGEFTGNFINLSRVKLPYDGAEFPVDVTIVFKSPGRRTAFYALLDVNPPYATKISMINAPAKLDFGITGKLLHAWFFWKVVHTLPMVAG